MNFRIGLDIGIASVGWAVLENDERDEPRRIVDLGVRVFDAAEVPKTGEALAAARRGARTTRRRLRRRKHRLERIWNLLEQEGMISREEFLRRYEQKDLPNVYQLRYEALDRLLTEEEFAQILIHIAKHRGFKSTRKAGTKENEKEEGKVLEAIKQNEELMKEKGYRTVGEMIYKDEAFRIDAPWTAEGYLLAPRNKEGNYKHTILRDLLVKEVQLIFSIQRTFQNPHATESFEKVFLTILTGQRSFDKGPGNQPNGLPSPYAGDLIEKMVGKCTFEKEERRAPKASYTAERFVLLQKVNHCKIVDKEGNVRGLTKEERESLIDLAYSKRDVKYTAIRDKLKLNETDSFKDLNYSDIKVKDNETDNNSEINAFKIKEEKEIMEKRKEIMKKVETAKWISLQYYHDFKKRLPQIHWKQLSAEEIELLDTMAEILTLYKSDESRIERLQKFTLTDEQIDSLLELNPSKFQHLSFKAIKKILPYLEEGFIYKEACDKAGYDFSGTEAKEKSVYLKGEVISGIWDDIPNPVVKRSISQTIKVINAIIQKYGSPQAVHIELAREMAKNFQERQQLEKQMKKNQEQNETVIKEIREYGVANPTGQDILKYRLWKEQQGICVYSGNKIPIGHLFERGEYDIDHIVPYSISYDDSYKNKVLVEARCNREKGNRLPYGYLGDKESFWNKYEALVNSIIRDARKRQLLLKKEFTEEEQKAFKERNLTDTKYITRVVYNLIRNNLYLAPYSDTTKDNKVKKVFAVNGSITAYLRKRWGLGEKSRDTDKHHAKDAVVVACCTDRMIQRISKNIQGRELAYQGNFQFIDVETGEIRNRFNFTREQWDEEYGVKVPMPWNWFRTELEMRMADDPMYFMEDLRKLGYPYNEKVEPIFVSRMPNHKVTGAVHADTIRSPRHFKEGGIVLTKTDLCSLKLDKDGEIQDYYDQGNSDRRLYEALKKQMQLFGGDAKKAFAEPFYKPRRDGKGRGPLVRKVKLEKKITSGVMLNHCTGIAENAGGSMIRIDIFKENGKYFFVPIYIKDTLEKELPNRAATGGKRKEEWRVMKEENFLFSLYPKDLIYIEKSSGIKLCESVAGEKKKEKLWAYFTGADISTVSIKGIAHDRSFKFRELGIQSLNIFKKYHVGILGERNEIKSEKRQKFHRN